MGGKSREALGIDEGIVSEATSDDSGSSVNATFWDVGDMTRPNGCPKGDCSGMTWGFDGERGLVMLDPGHTPAERTGGLLGGKNCIELSKGISASVSASVSAACAEGRRNQGGAE